MRFVLGALFASMLVSASFASGAKVYDSEIPGVALAGTIFISGAWTRQSPPGVTVGSAYFRIKNNGDVAERLLGGEVDFADRVEVHKMEMKDGVMSMFELEDGLTIQPGETISFEPGGYHLMIMGLEEQPMAGDIVPMTLDFSEAGLVDLLLPVAPIGAKEFSQ